MGTIVKSGTVLTYLEYLHLIRDDYQTQGHLFKVGLCSSARQTKHTRYVHQRFSDRFNQTLRAYCDTIHVVWITFGQNPQAVHVDNLINTCKYRTYYWHIEDHISRLEFMDKLIDEELARYI